MGYSFVADNTGYSFSCYCLPNLRKSERIRGYSRSRSFKVIDLNVNRKRIYDFLLVVNSNDVGLFDVYGFRDFNV